MAPLYKLVTAEISYDTYYYLLYMVVVLRLLHCLHRIEEFYDYLLNTNTLISFITGCSFVYYDY